MSNDGSRHDSDSIDTGLQYSRRSVLAATGLAGLGLAGTAAAGARNGGGGNAESTLDGLVDAAKLPPLFDCNAWVGETDVNPIAFRLYRPDPELGEGLPERNDMPADLVEEMDRTGVDRALVYHITARTEDAKAGNERLMDAIADFPRLEPSWVVTPDAIDEYGGASAFVETMEEAGVGAVRMFPGEWSWMHPDEEDWQLTDEELEPVLEELKEANAIVLLDSLSKRSGGFGFGDLVDVCKKYEASSPDESELSFILTQQFPPVDIPDGPMVEAVRSTENLYADTSRFQEFQGPRRFVDEVGLDRLLFGTHAPHSSIGASLGTVMQSQLTEEEKRQVSWGNLADLLVDTPSRLGDPGRGTGGNSGRDGEIAPGGSAGRGRGHGAAETHFKTVPYGIIDLHGHISGNGDDLVSEMDRTGIDLSCVSNLSGDPAGNTVTAEAAERHPDRLVPMAYADPDMDDLGAEMERCFDELGMRMIKIHPDGDGVLPDNSVYDPVYELANEREALVCAHAKSFDEEIQAFKDVASEYRDMTLMLYHAARSWPAADKYASVVWENDNVLLEITYSYVIDGLVAHLIDLVGPEKVFFGTDIPRAPQNQVGWATYEPLTAEERRLHMRENGLELLDELGALPTAYQDEV
ncbi:amidohydrolase family protein [Halomontanus rarus]|uniref:amidohydrolase family protein n=1 Tax=Halomontanus rarus TaxID=3034020 RepID=UPI0023E80227|nr:amidohydrolase family protein [Halovivax sp. TS33]